MAKWELIDDSAAPENLSGMSSDAREKLEMLRALVPGKTLMVPVGADKQKGFKAALTRLANKQGMTVEVWGNAEKVYIRLAANSDAGASQAE